MNEAGAQIVVRGTRIVYAERGEGRPVVCLHGNTGSRRWFERVMEATGCRVIAPDLPGFGESEALPDAPDIARYADAAADFIHALRLTGTVLVGHSLGGAVAMSVAVRSPDLLGGLVLVDSAPPSGFPTPEARHPLIERMRTDRELLAAALRATVPALGDEQFFSRLVDDATRMARPAWIGNALALGAFSCVRECGVFSKPVLVVWGRRDVIVTEEMARETAQAFPRGRFMVLDHVGHSPPVEDPPGFVRALVSFVGSLEREAEGCGKERS